MMRSRQLAFTLVEIAVVIVIASILIAIFAGLSSGLLAQQRRQTTVTRLSAIDASLVQYVVQQKRLPCPADGSAAAGIEVGSSATGCTGDQARGVVPWITLGLSESEILDGWGRRITYRLDPTLAGTNRMNMSQCDPAGNAGVDGVTGLCVSPCTNASIALCTTPANYLSGKGLTVKLVSDVSVTLMNPAGTPNTGAAYVLISHGESGGSGYLNTGTSFTSSSTDGTQETQNYANLPLAALYVDGEVSDVPGSGHFDDLVLRPSVLAVITRAGLGPRSH